MPRSLGLGQAPGTTPQGCKPAMDAIAHRLLPAVLRENGYRTKAVSANMWVCESSGFDIGFDDFVSINAKRTAKMDRAGLRARAKWRFEAVQARVDDGAEEAGRIIRGWANDPGDEPFFWFVNLVECHSPYLPPTPYNSLGVVDRARAADEASEFLTLEAIWRACAGALEVPTDALERMKSLYADAIRYEDAWVGDLLDSLDRAGKLDDTLVIVTSDHGENFAEVDGLMAHAFSLDERLVHVPLVSAGPIEVGGESAFSLLNLPGQLATRLKLESNPYESASQPGIVVSEFDTPAPIDDPRWQGLLAKWDIDPVDAPRRLGSNQTAATDGRWKLVEMQSGESNLYDLEADPMELNPVDPIVVDESICSALHRAIATSAKAATDPTDHVEPEISDEERRRLEDSMRLLGYM